MKIESMKQYRKKINWLPAVLAGLWSLTGCGTAGTPGKDTAGSASSASPPAATAPSGSQPAGSGSGAGTGASRMFPPLRSRKRLPHREGKGAARGRLRAANR
ncbi:hypothetical protein LJK88_12950 [Paenibacillus sp. P26]|nr:hypothetical protein LJK88_12950 [Paenibacillus sp. P26]UUZ89365.1 hypothetical protein LJK87_24730 [Paenibacillus sp. P25]